MGTRTYALLKTGQVHVVAHEDFQKEQYFTYPEEFSFEIANSRNLIQPVNHSDVIMVDSSMALIFCEQKLFEQFGIR